MSLMDIPDVAQHSTPSLSARYVPTVHGFQQTIGVTSLSYSLFASASFLYTSQIFT